MDWQMSVSSLGSASERTSSLYGIGPARAANHPGPTWHGYIHDSTDALIIIEACLNGKLPQCTRRPQREERWMVHCGAVFVYEENTSGIKRWTDGLNWTPSRAIGDFLIYRELGQPHGQPHGHGPQDSDLYKKTIGITHGADSFRLVAYFSCAPTMPDGQSQVRPIYDLDLVHTNPRPQLRLRQRREGEEDRTPRLEQDVAGTLASGSLYNTADEIWAQLLDAREPARPVVSPPNQYAGELDAHQGTGAGWNGQRQPQPRSSSPTGAVVLLAREIGVPLDYVQQMIDAWKLSERDGRFSLDSELLAHANLFR